MGVSGIRSLVAAAAIATAAAAAAKAAATAATGTAAAEAAWTLFAGTCFVDHEITACHGLTMKTFDRSLGFGIAAHFHKAEALGTAGVTIAHDFSRRDRAEFAELLFEVFVAHGVRQIADVQFVAHDWVPFKIRDYVHSSRVAESAIPENPGTALPRAEATLRFGGSTSSSFEMAESDATFGQVIRGQFQGHVVAGQNTDVVLAHFSCRVGDERVPIFERDAVTRVR
jgi:hypothetical protein